MKKAKDFTYSILNDEKKKRIFEDARNELLTRYSSVACHFTLKAVHPSHDHKLASVLVAKSKNTDFSSIDSRSILGNYNVILDKAGHGSTQFDSKIASFNLINNNDLNAKQAAHLFSKTMSHMRTILSKEESEELGIEEFVSVVNNKEVISLEFKSPQKIKELSSKQKNRESDWQTRSKKKIDYLGLLKKRYGSYCKYLTDQEKNNIIELLNDNFVYHFKDIFANYIGEENKLVCGGENDIKKAFENPLSKKIHLPLSNQKYLKATIVQSLTFRSSILKKIYSKVNSDLDDFDLQMIVNYSENQNLSISLLKEYQKDNIDQLKSILGKRILCANLQDTSSVQNISAIFGAGNFGYIIANPIYSNYQAKNIYSTVKSGFFVSKDLISVLENVSRNINNRGDISSSNTLNFKKSADKNVEWILSTVLDILNDIETRAFARLSPSALNKMSDYAKKSFNLKGDDGKIVEKDKEWVNHVVSKIMDAKHYVESKNIYILKTGRLFDLSGQKYIKKQLTERLSIATGVKKIGGKS